MARSTVHYADNETNNILRKLHNKLRPAGTPVQRVEYIIELLLLRVFEVKLKQDKTFEPLRKLFSGENYCLLFSHLNSLTGEQIKEELNKNIFPFYANILTKAREVFPHNLPQKVQDQLVLIEEVFANSSFSTNVQSGNMSEIIGLVQDINEERVLKTDLLGDAIESALSEQGGTRDIGLYRTPDHIRQMMVALVNPNFNDTIFDPSCGTGGFLFDAYQYVLQKVTKDNKWAGEKSHPELQNYFTKYFQQFNTKMPSLDIANSFYRQGIGGIEYLGMIRKMAAINLYIRGLNPQNILQGDSLKIYDPAIDGESKSVVIANPPFGAERDQPAYPNVWEEYSRESETTILFVKLMFDLLKKGGRCAVVVSEGFLTWGQNSARALRKKLLEEANLRAIISLPQGVFVSKSGQGAKTSILYFEKGEPTKYIWYYKIENDGFSMGTNRKQIAGCQIPEIIEIFTNYIKQDKKPPETKNSFIIPVEWIITLDPRIKERIKKETTQELQEKNKSKREILIARCKNVRTEQCSVATDNEKLIQFDNVLENKIQNEIAKRIERAYLYSFNLQNYKSNLNEEQIKEWKAIIRTEQCSVPTNILNISQIYEQLNNPTIKLKEKIKALVYLNPLNSLHIDIAREFVGANDNLPILKKLDEIFKKGNKYAVVPLKELIIINNEKIKPNNHLNIEFLVLGVSNEIGVFINEKKKGEEINQTYYKVLQNQFCYNPYRVNVGSIGLNEFNFDNQIISGAYNVFGVKETEILPKYLFALFKTKKFLDYVNELASGGVRMDFKIEYLQDWQIPLPPLEIQQEIIEKIEKQKAIIEGAEKIEEVWRPEYSKDNCELKKLGDVIELQRGYDLPKYEFKEGNISVMGSNGIIGYHNIAKHKAPGVITGRSGTIGKIHFVDTDYWPHNTSLFVKDFKGNDPKFIFFLLQNIDLKKLADNTTAVPSLDRKNAYTLDVYIPPLEIQHQIVEQLDKEMSALENIRFLKNQAEKRIAEILNEVWGENESK